MAADLGLNRSTIKVLVTQLAADEIVAERLPIVFSSRHPARGIRRGQ